MMIPWGSMSPLFKSGIRGSKEQVGVASGAGHQVGPGDLIRVYLGQPVDRLAAQFVVHVRAVVALVDLGVPESEVRGQVDDSLPGRQPGLYRVHGHLVGQGGEHVFGLFQGRIGQGDELEVLVLIQGGKILVDRLSLGLPRGHGGQLHLGVGPQNTKQLQAGIPGAAYDCRADHCQSD